MSLALFSNTLIGDGAGSGPSMAVKVTETLAFAIAGNAQVHYFMDISSGSLIKSADEDISGITDEVRGFTPASLNQKKGTAWVLLVQGTDGNHYLQPLTIQPGAKTAIYGTQTADIKDYVEGLGTYDCSQTAIAIAATGDKGVILIGGTDPAKTEEVMGGVGDRFYRVVLSVEYTVSGSTITLGSVTELLNYWYYEFAVDVPTDYFYDRIDMFWPTSTGVIWHWARYYWNDGLGSYNDPIHKWYAGSLSSVGDWDSATYWFTDTNLEITTIGGGQLPWHFTNLAGGSSFTVQKDNAGVGTGWNTIFIFNGGTTTTIAQPQLFPPPNGDAVSISVFPMGWNKVIVHLDPATSPPSLNNRPRVQEATISGTTITWDDGNGLYLGVVGDDPICILAMRDGREAIAIWKEQSTNDYYASYLKGLTGNAPPVGDGLFYYDEGLLLKRENSPIDLVEIGGMALAGDVVYMGSRAANAPMVARSLEPPYTTWEDLTASLPDDGIVAFDVTPWGDQDDKGGDKDDENSGGWKGGPGGKCE